MIILIEYTSAHEGEDAFKYLRDKFEMDKKIALIDYFKISVEYSGDLEEFENEFMKYGCPRFIYSEYKLTTGYRRKLEEIKKKLDSYGFKYEILSDKSMIIKSVCMTLYELYGIINFENILLEPYDNQKTHMRMNNDFSLIYPSGKFSDMEIHVQDTVFKVHKSIMINASKYILTYFQWHPDRMNINIDADPELFKQLLDLIYGLEIKIDGLKTLSLIQLAESLEITQLKKEEIIKSIKIDKEESNEYIDILSKIYPYKIPYELLEIIESNIDAETDLSILTKVEQERLKK